MNVSNLPSCCYRVNSLDEITWVDTAWMAFAQENGAPALAGDNILGQSLWKYLADRSTRSFYKKVHQRVRSSGQTLTLPVRCDSPNLKRHMQLSIASEDAGTLHYQSTILRVQLQPHLALLDTSAKRSADRMTICSCCQKLLIEPSGWVEIEEVASKLHLYESKTAPNLFYAVCPNCEQAV